MTKIYIRALLAVPALLIANFISAQINSVLVTPPAGPTVSYPSITSAYAAIPNAPAGNYLIELQSLYNGNDASEIYPITLGDKGLLPGGFTITIRPAAGNNTAVIQRPVAAAGVVISINGGDNIILDGRPGGISSAPANYLTVNDAFSGSSSNRDIEILNGGNNNTIEYINATAAQATAAALGSRVIMVSTSAVANNNNIITNNVVTGGLRGIQVFGTVVNNSGTVIANNAVSNFGAIGIFGGNFQDNTTIQSNTINFTVMPLTTAIIGIQNQGTTVTTNIIDNNISLPLTTNSSATTIFGIANTSNGTVNILRNTITNITGNGGTSVGGISISPGTVAGGIINIGGNIISAINSNAVAAGFVQGIVSGGGTVSNTLNISGNKISDLSTTGPGNLRGISLFPFSGSTLNVNNNFVSITQTNATATAIFGMLFGLTGTTNPYTSNVYFNSVRIGGTQTGGTAANIYATGIYRSDNTAGSVFNMKNNISIMDRSGGTAGIYLLGFFNNSAAGTLSIDNNTYSGTAGAAGNAYAAGWVGSVYDNTQLAAYQTAAAPNEAATNFTPVTFVSNTDLHLSGASTTDPNLNGVPAGGIATDIDAQTRSAVTPIRGADEPNAVVNSVFLTPPVGPPVGYPSITSAYAAIPNAPAGNYLVELQSNYNGTDASELYPITLGDKGLLPGGFTITIRPAAGNNTAVIQRPVAAAGVVISINGGDNIILDGRPGGIVSAPANYLTVNDAFSGSNTNRDIEILNGANNNMIEYINATAAQATAAAVGSRIIMVSTSAVANNNNIITNNVVTGGLRGIQVFGTVVNNSGTVITNNTITNFGAIGIFGGNFQDNTTIQSNTINFTVMPLTTGITGIQNQGTTVTTNITDNNVSIPLTNTVTTSIIGIVNVGNGTVNILRNTISNLTGNGATSVIGISNNPGTVAATVNLTGNTISALNTNAVAASFVIGISQSTGTTVPVTLNISGNKISNISTTNPGNLRAMSLFPFSGSTLNVNNNFVSITQANTTATAILGILFGLSGTTNPYTSNVYFNSVRIGGTQTGGTAGTIYAVGIYRNDNTAGSVFNMKNNISIMDRSGGTAGIFMLGFFNTSAVGTLSIDNNTYSGTAGAAGNAYAAGWVASVYDNTQLAAYQTAAAPNEAAANFTPVTFVSNTDLHLSGASNTDPALDGVPAGGITTDIDGQSRSATSPTRGGDEKPFTVLASTLTAFTAYRNGAVNNVIWTTQQEVNTQMFIVEHSVDGRSFTRIGDVAAAGNSSTPRNYQFIDRAPVKGINYYRLRSVDLDNASKLSVIKSVKNLGDMDISIYPNPVQSLMNIEMYSDKAGTGSISIYDLSGTLVYKKAISIANGKNIFNLDLSNLAKGSYSIRLSTDEGMIVKKFVRL